MTMQRNIGLSEVAALGQRGSLSGAAAVGQALKPANNLGLWWGYLDHQDWVECLKNVADHVALQDEVMSDAAYDAATRAYTKAGPAARLHFYATEKTNDMWAEQQAKYPRDFEEDWADYQRLKVLAAEGRLAEET